MVVVVVVAVDVEEVVVVVVVVSVATAPPSETHSASSMAGEELIQNMDRVDREITMVEQQICKLRKKQPCSAVVRGAPAAMQCSGKGSTRSPAVLC
ncbi:hypothetical protein CRUP_023377 [Coryphaenoides rupestris]|nr:hypothetical protein CRUP_023377 [Coryphaenoides rupestris]